ncbi:MAG TPA: TolC family protein [Anaeromyxobacter sp.]|nr:TolC family protein [Anaeromyxobacter sp.]
MSSFIVVALALVAAQAQTQPQTPPAGQAPAAPAPRPQAPPPAAQPAPPQAAPAAEVITIQDALRSASERNLDLKVLSAQLAQAEEISWKAWSGYLPRASLSGAWQAQKSQVARFPRDFNDPAAGTVPIEIQPGSVLQGQAEVSQAILSPALIFGIRQATAAERAATLNIANGRRSLLFGVAGTYYAAAALKETVGVSVRLLEVAQRQEKDARVRYQAGTIAKVGLLRAEIDRARAEQDLKRARNSYESQRLALATLLDRDTSFDVTPPPPPPLAADPNPDELVKLALDLRLDVKAARADIDAAHAFRNGAAARYLPNVGAFARYSRRDAAGALGGGEDWAAGLALTWSILDGGLRESDIREGNARIAQADAAARLTEARARQEVVQALIDLDSARANIAKAREQRDLAAENSRLVDVSYRAGAATAVELADATAALRTAEIGVVTEQLNAQLAALRVLLAVGEFDPEAKR